MRERALRICVAIDSCCEVCASGSVGWFSVAHEANPLVTMRSVLSRHVVVGGVPSRVHQPLLSVIGRAPQQQRPQLVPGFSHCSSHQTCRRTTGSSRRCALLINCVWQQALRSARRCGPLPSGRRHHGWRHMACIVACIWACSQLPYVHIVRGSHCCGRPMPSAGGLPMTSCSQPSRAALIWCQLWFYM